MHCPNWLWSAYVDLKPGVRAPLARIETVVAKLKRDWETVSMTHWTVVYRGAFLLNDNRTARGGELLDGGQMHFPLLVRRQLQLHLTYLNLKLTNLSLKAKIFHLKLIRRLLQLA